MHSEALALALSALDLIAKPERPDGTYNRDRRACEMLARETLAKINALRAPAAAQAEAFTLTASPGSCSATPNGPFVVFSDGGCKGNPGPSGWGCVVTAGGKVISEDSGFIGTATNQVAELTAAIEALKRTPEGATVELVSDSEYTLKGLTEWRKGWERRGMRTAGGDPVKNLPFWKELYALADKRKVTTRWVRGHSGDPYNERCDALASQAIAANR